MKRIELVYFNAGGGHRAAALALEQALACMGQPWRVSRVNLVELIDPTSSFRRLFGFDPEDIYNKRLASGFTLGLSQELKLLQGAIRLAHGSLVRRLAAHWGETKPDLVVSLIPNFNRAMHDALAFARPGVPYVTVLTDMADHPPSFWIEPGTAQHVLCGTAHAAQQALAAGVPREQVHEVSGMLLRPDFHLPFPPDCEMQLHCVARPANKPAGLVLFGGAGSRAMKRIAERLPDVPLILMCGRNEALAESLRALPAQAPRVVVGFTPDVARWMSLADFFIGKPGPGSLSEAVQMGLPVIVTRNAWTMPQERWNTEWVQERGVGVVRRSFADIADAVAELTARLPEYRSRVARVSNRALFEVPCVLERLLDRASARAAPDPDEVPTRPAVLSTSPA
jgi:UDP-N-acetylglucosamine:LPS N-acetylglucosamine transferase